MLGGRKSLVDVTGRHGRSDEATLFEVLMAVHASAVSCWLRRGDSVEGSLTNGFGPAGFWHAWQQAARHAGKAALWRARRRADGTALLLACVAPRQRQHQVLTLAL